MNLRKLRIFYETATELNMTKVAKKLYISQPSISQAVQELEEELNVKVFERMGKRIKLTYEGEIYFNYVRRILNLYDEGMEKINNINNSNEGIIKIGASTSIGTYIIPQIIKEFSKQHSNIKIELTIGNTEEIENKILENKIDLAFIEGNIHLEEIKETVFKRDELIFIGSTDFMENEVIKKEDLKNYNLIMRERGSGTREIIEEAFLENDIDHTIFMEVGNTEAIKRSVENNIGIGCVSKLCVKREIKNGYLKEIKLEGISIKRDLYFIHHKDKFISNNMKIFIEVLESYK